ncbi:hypothetical protein F4774DRAFT_421487 [Daldinia eschscholtzii]|nr:hypothetical protein F4774DRAFT_421487 [Daldinia eschscholtzii]
MVCSSNAEFTQVLYIFGIMELSHELAQAIWSPSFVLQYPHLRTQYGQISPVGWDASGLNPRNRVNALHSCGALRWRIDGGTYGTRFFAAPLDISVVPPLRIDIFIPDVPDIPRALRDSLDASSGVPLRKSDVAKTSIARHVCRALDMYCKDNPSFLSNYLRLPFGSSIVFENIPSNLADINITVVPNYYPEWKAPSLKTLQTAWRDILPPEQWPLIIDLMDLSLVKYLHDTVALVRIPESVLATSDGLAVFKHNTEDFEDLLHELKFLLGMPPHPNIMPRPLAIVTKKSNFGGKQAILGFLLPNFELGSLREILPSRRASGNLKISQQLSWCKEITSALIHIRNIGAFYSDLRPDNVLVSVENRDRGTAESAVLCDFEQRGNWYEWCPPEILYAQYAENMRKSEHSIDAKRTWDDLLTYSLADHGRAASRNRAWSSMSPEAQEKAMVYCLGLFIYCVFEGQSNICGNKANQFTVGGLLYPNGKTDRERDTADMACEVLDAAFISWERELKSAKEFLGRGHDFITRIGKIRPKLEEVLDRLLAVELLQY